MYPLVLWSLVTLSHHTLPNVKSTFAVTTLRPQLCSSFAKHGVMDAVDEEYSDCVLSTCLLHLYSAVFFSPHNFHRLPCLCAQPLHPSIHLRQLRHTPTCTRSLPVLFKLLVEQGTKSRFSTMALLPVVLLGSSIYSQRKLERKRTLLRAFSGKAQPFDSVSDLSLRRRRGGGYSITLAVGRFH